jgi:phospholipase/lecithinase/hemolysin
MIRSLAVTAALLSAVPAAAAFPSQIYVFGDSLVDSGNITAAVGGDFFNPVAQGYFPGRFTNGPNYNDLLYNRAFGNYMTPSLLGGTNFAFGAARIANNGDAVPDLALQLGAYLAASGNTADPNALYIINAGGNDVFGLESGTIGGFADAGAYTASLLDTLSGSIQTLSALGAGRILVTGIPNLTATGIGLEAQVQARLNTIEPTLGSTDLLRFSYQSFFLALAANPGAFGLPPFDQTGNCRDNEIAVHGRIDCTGYFSFDGIHPTAAVQRAVSFQVADVLGIVPEPSSWAMLIAGFGLIGATMRRKRSALA